MLIVCSKDRTKGAVGVNGGKDEGIRDDIKYMK